MCETIKPPKSSIAILHSTITATLFRVTFAKRIKYVIKAICAAAKNPICHKSSLCSPAISPQAERSNAIGNSLLPPVNQVVIPRKATGNAFVKSIHSQWLHSIAPRKRYSAPKRKKRVMTTLLLKIVLQFIDKLLRSATRTLTLHIYISKNGLTCINQRARFVINLILYNRTYCR